MVNGSLVSLDPKRSDYVQPANSGNGSRLLGVVSAGNDSLLAADSDTGTVQVATSGNVPVLVSTEGGNVKLGDRISVSPFNGVGMKAASGLPVIGLAQTALDENTQGAVTQTVTDEKGNSTRITVGLVRINIAINTAGVAPVEANLTGLQRLAKSITGRDISNARVIAAFLVVVISLLALITLIYASIYGSIVSIGRNPLAKYAVFRALGSVLGLAGLTVAITAITLFFLLR